MVSTPSTVEPQRKALAQGEAEGLKVLGPCPPDLGEAWIDIPLPGGQFNRAKVIFPKPLGGETTPTTAPLVVYFHGGGFSVGSPDVVVAPARGFATLFRTVVVCPSLNQLPERPFPVPVQIAWEVCSWLSDADNLNGGLFAEESVRVDPARGFVVGGLSAGGGAVAAIGGISSALSAGSQDFGDLTPLRAPITGIFAGIPMMVTEATVPLRYAHLFRSRQENADPEGKITTMTRELEELIGEAASTPWLSPINLALPAQEIARGHPPKVYSYAGGLDPFRDDCVIYNDWLSGLPGIESRTRLLEDENHTGWVTLPMPACHSRTIKEVTLDGMAWLLGVEWDREQTELPW